MIKSRMKKITKKKEQSFSQSRLLAKTE
jgi:hypothetical protein